MSNFIKEITKFIGLTVLSALIFSLFYSYQIKRQFSSNSKTVVLGDSRLANGFNTNISNEAQNLASSAETYYFARLKLQALIQDQIPSNVILGYSSHNLAGSLDSIWVFGQTNVSHHLSKYYPLISFQELKYLASIYGNMAVINSIPSALKKGPYAIEKYIFNNTLPYIGGFVPLSGCDNFSDTNNPNDYVGISRFQLENLLLIDSICQFNDIKLYLVNTPNLVNQDTITLKSITSSLKSNFEYLDFSDSINELRLFHDEQHLNEWGSIVFTKMLLKEISANY